MNNDIMKGKWKQVSGSVKEKWGKLTDDDIQEIDGNLEVFQGKMQEKYGMEKDEAEKVKHGVRSFILHKKYGWFLF